jgi:hypothetical protein
MGAMGVDGAVIVASSSISISSSAAAGGVSGRLTRNIFIRKMFFLFIFYLISQKSI